MRTNQTTKTCASTLFLRSFGDYQEWGLRDLRQDPLLPCAYFSMNLHLAPSPVQENSLGWRARARIGFLHFGRPSTYFPERAPVPLRGSRSPLGLQPERDPEIDARKQHRRSPTENSRIKFIIACFMQPSSEKIALPSLCFYPLNFKK